MAIDFAARPAFARPAHPGTVTFVGADGAERTEPADRIPEWLSYAPDANGSPVPVVRVVQVATGRGPTLRSYNADGQLVWVGLAASAVPPADAVTTPRPAPARFIPAARPSAWDRAEPTGWF